MTTLVPLSISPEEYSSNGHNHDALAREYIEALKRGETPEQPDAGRWKSLCDTLDIVKGDANAIQKTLKASGIHKKYPGLKLLLDPPVANSSASVGRANDKTSSLEVVRNEMVAPPLEWGLLPKELGMGVSHWFDEYLQFSKRWSPRACEIQHIGVALWILSAVAMRRVVVKYGGLQPTPLYIILVAPSTVYAKTKTAQIGTSLIRQVGLQWILGADRTTPEKLLSRMAGKYNSSELEGLAPDKLEIALKRLAHSGQLGWYYSEFGSLLRDFDNEKGYRAELKSVLQRMDDNEVDASNDTHIRGNETIEYPYIALLGTMTPDCMKPYSASNSANWGDGTYARFAFCCPPADKKKTREDLRNERFPDEDRIFPMSLLTPLRKWHDRLGERSCRIVEEEKEDVKGNKKIVQDIQRDEHYPQTILTLAPGVKDALDDYGDAVALLAQDLRLPQFQSVYGRLRDKTLRIATLIASFEGSQTIDLSHMAFAQHITEGLRESIHHLDMFLRYNPLASTRTRTEDEIIAYLAKCNEPKTARDIRMANRSLQGVNPEELRKIMETLAKDGEITIAKRQAGDRTEKYESKQNNKN